MSSCDLSQQKDCFSKNFEICRPLFSALGDENRQLILKLLIERCEEGGLRVGEIQKCTNISRTAVSHHLKVLLTAGLIGCQPQGTMNFYFLDSESATVQTVIRFWKEAEQRMLRCPYRKGGNKR